MPFGPALPNGVRTPSTKTTSLAVRGTVTPLSCVLSPPGACPVWGSPRRRQGEVDRARSLSPDFGGGLHSGSPRVLPFDTDAPVGSLTVGPGGAWWTSRGPFATGRMRLLDVMLLAGNSRA